MFMEARITRASFICGILGCCGIGERAEGIARITFFIRSFLMRRLLVLAGIAATLLMSGVDAQAPMDRVRVGVLECRGGASVGFIVGSVTNLGCVLRVEGMPEDRYIATISKVGLDLGITQ